MKPSVLIVLIGLLVLSACAIQKDREIPSNFSGGADQMRLSPCVCLELEDYDGSGFEWQRNNS